MPRLVILPGHSFVIHGRRMNAGDEFECSEREAIIWRAKLWAADVADVPAPQPRNRYKRADMRAEDEH